MNLLQRMMAAKESASNHKIGYAHAVRHYVAQNSVQTYDRGITVNGASDNLLRLMKKSEFDKKLQRVGYELSKEGKGFALVCYLIGEMQYIDYARVYDYTKIAGDLREIYLWTESTFTKADQNYPILIKFEKIAGEVVKSEGVFIENEWLITDTSRIRVYEGFTEIPVEILENNALGLPDIPCELLPMLNELDFYGNELGNEWDFVKTQFLNNQLFGSEKDGAQWQSEMNGKQRVHDVSDTDGKLQGALAPLISGSTTPAIILQNIEFLEDKIFKFAMQYREQATSGTNKMNLEVALGNQQAYEYMTAKMEHRQEQLESFFQKLEPNVTVDMEIPELEDYRIRNMSAQVDLLEAQAEAARSAATKPEQTVEEQPQGE